MALFCISAAPAWATWSVVAIDTLTQEVAVGSATCVSGIDLKAFSPVIVVGAGAGAAQSQVDASGERRTIIWNGLQTGLSSQEILDQLVLLSGVAVHQHGIADTGGDSATFTGSSNGAHASGVAGAHGRIHYAIQGNVLTGSPVVSEAEAAFVSTDADLPGRLMASMEAARLMGGDGRCSCAPGSPTGCGSPPPSFTKSAHVGFLLLARYGDTDDDACNASGCADGDYFLGYNIPFQSQGDEDPVLQLQTLFDAWRADLVGRPDAVASTVRFAHAAGDFVLELELYDWREIPLGSAVDSVVVEHAPGSDAVTSIGPVADLGDGRYQVPLAWTGSEGTDIFLITIDDGIRPVVIPPGRAILIPATVFSDDFESGDVSSWNTVIP